MAGGKGGGEREAARQRGSEAARQRGSEAGRREGGEGEREGGGAGCGLSPPCCSLRLLRSMT